MDVQKMRVVDFFDLSKFEIVVSTKFSEIQTKRGLRINVRAYSQSIADIDGNVYLQGQRSVHLIGIFT